ncbi:MAG: LysR family transcriptional regulator [Rhodobacteraceae bacterium]|nr:MAG: LysR family transcriptional regulator [Paracoccaceae bacterium]
MDPAGLDLAHSFLAVAEELNFRRAAERLALDQSALTRRIQKLEDRLGFRLFERTTRDVALTPAGRQFYDRAARLIADYGEAVEAARLTARGVTGRLRVGYMEFAATELLPETLARFRAAHPGVDVALRAMRTQGQKVALAQGEIDLGFLIGPFDHPDFHAVTLRDEALRLVAARGAPLLAQAAATPAEIAAAPLVLGDMAEWEAYRRHLEALFAAEGAALAPAVEASNTLAILGLVAAGLGATVWPESLARHLGRSLETRPIARPGFRVATALVWRRANRAAAVTRFVEAARAAAAGVA